MSQVVRTPVHVDKLRHRRNIEERLIVRFPGAYRVLAAAMMRLSPRSRLRRMMLRRNTLSGWAAFSRGDLDLMLVRYAPDYEFEPASELVAVGMLPAYRGHSGLRSVVRDGSVAWEQMVATPSEIVDADEQVVVLGTYRTRGGLSGIEFETPYAATYQVEGGLVVRERTFASWEAGLRAAGIEE
jgi:ketosteroid isomerase-like protein